MSQKEESPASSQSRSFSKRVANLKGFNAVPTENDRKSGRDKLNSGKHISCSSSIPKWLQIEKLKREIFEIVDEHPDGLLCSELTGLYRQQHGRDLNYARLGHTSLLSAALALGLRAARDGYDYRVGRTTPRHVRPAPRVFRRTRVVCEDDEDALPGVPVDKAAFPDDCMQYLDVIPRVSVSDLNAGSRCDVMPAEVHSPSHVWLIRDGEQYHTAMEAVMDDMAEYYRRGPGATRVIAPAAVKVGHYVACLFEGDWHRAIIVRRLDCDFVKVRYIDYGTVQTVEVRSLKPLLKTFGKLQAQAVRARLAGIRPANAARRWQHATALSLLQLLQNTMFVAQVQQRHVTQDSSDILDVLLVKHVCVNDELVRQGHAEPMPDAPGDDESWLRPHFAALEAGATLSLDDCLTYMRQGIELDYVDDYRRHVAPLLPPPPLADPEPRRSPTPPTPYPTTLPTPSPPPPPIPRRSPSPQPPPSPTTYHTLRPTPPAPPLTFNTIEMYGPPSPGHMPVSLAPPPGFGRQHAHAPPPATFWAGSSAVSPSRLSPAEREVLPLVASLQPKLALRFLAERLRLPAPTPFNPLAPKFFRPRY